MIVEIPYLVLFVGVALLAFSVITMSEYIGSVCFWLSVFTLFTACFALSAERIAVGCVLQDDVLQRWDAGLGCNARGITEWVRGHRWMDRISMIAYFSFVPQIMLAILVVKARGLFVCRMIATALVTLAIFAALPAVGNYVDAEAASHNAPIKSHMLALSAGEVDVIRIADCEGIICAPSYHTIVGVLLIAAFWRSPFRWWAVVLNVLMIASTVPTGGHYVVDVLLGLIVGIISLKYLTWRE